VAEQGVTEVRMLGIIGGVGPESTGDYYRRLIGRWRERGPADTYPSILIDSLNSRAALGAMLAGDIEPAVQLFSASAERLAHAGAGLALVASVMMHMAFEPVAAQAPIPMLSILDAMVSEAKRREIRRPGILATRPTTEGAFFARPFDAAGIELVRPDEADRAWIHDIYFSELVRGTFHDETRWRLISIVEKMWARSDIDAVILGGTELPLILREPSYAGVPVLDSTGIHVEAALDWLLGGDAAIPA
jgi:aspartate racemase